MGGRVGKGDREGDSEGGDTRGPVLAIELVLFDNKPKAFFKTSLELYLSLLRTPQIRDHPYAG